MLTLSPSLGEGGEGEGGEGGGERHRAGRKAASAPADEDGGCKERGGSSEDERVEGRDRRWDRLAARVAV